MVLSVSELQETTTKEVEEAGSVISFCKRKSEVKNVIFVQETVFPPNGSLKDDDASSRPQKLLYGSLKLTAQEITSSTQSSVNIIIK